MILRNKKILITGGSFIGSHLAKKLMDLNVAGIRVVNKSSRHRAYFNNMNVEFLERDLRELKNSSKSVEGADVVFHLAADHGGRGYVDSFQGKTASNFLLDGAVFKACLDEGVEKIVFASSGCVYPTSIQEDLKKEVYLTESDVKPPYEADNVYGWAKLMGEVVLQTYYSDFGLKSAIGRLFTVYGERAEESHAVLGTIAKTHAEQDPFRVWGSGNQIRNWTYVEDIVSGLVLLAEKAEDASAINLGTNERVSVKKMVGLVHDYMNYHPRKIVYVNNEPTGPLNRVADNRMAKKLLKWEPKYTFKDGLKRTVEWYVSNKDKKEVKDKLNDLLMGQAYV